MELFPGSSVDRYQLLKPLGSGGQGSVWLASDPLNPQAQIAIKLLELSSKSEVSIERLRREARQLIQLDHPSLVRSYALFEDLKLNVLGMVLGFVDGVPLNEALSREWLNEDQKWWVLTHLAGALSFIHNKKVVHRDLKPQNIILTSRFFERPDEPSHIKLVDFGIATSAADAASPLTQEGHLVGTLAYLAPEALLVGTDQVRRAPQVDIFAFGVLAWKLFQPGHPSGLSGAARLADYSIRYRELSQQGGWPPKTNLALLDQLLAQTLALNPNQRIPDGQALSQLFGPRNQFRLKPTASKLSNAQLPSASSLQFVAGENIPAETKIHGAPPAHHLPIAPSPAQPFYPQPEPSRAFSNSSPPNTGAYGPPVSAHTGSQYPSSYNTFEPSHLPAGAPPNHSFAPSPIAPQPSASAAASASYILVWIGAISILSMLAVIGLALLRQAKHSPVAQIPGAPGLGTTSAAASPGEAPTKPFELTTEPDEAKRGLTIPGTQANQSLPASCDSSLSFCACCPSGNDCMGACDEELAGHEQLALRYAGGGRWGHEALHLSIPGSLVCVSPSNLNRWACIPSEGQSSPISRAIDISAAELLSGVDVRVLNQDGRIISRRGGFAQPFKRSVFCKGFNIRNLEGDQRVDSVGFFVDIKHRRSQACHGK